MNFICIWHEYYLCTLYVHQRIHKTNSHYDDIVIVQHKFAAIGWLGQASDIAEQQAVEL